MKLAKPSKVELYGFFVAMPIIVVASNSILYKNRLFTDIDIWLFSFPLIYVLCFLSWVLDLQCDYFIRRQYPELKHTSKRIAAKLVTSVLIITPTILLFFLLYDYFHILGYQLQRSDLKWGFVTGFSINLIFSSLWEVLYLLEKYKQNLAQNNKLEKLSVAQDFETLKNQVNPHFLFNNFNTLSSLIQEDKQEAVRFLDELSKVYRYLLKNNESSISTLEKEINFIESYASLLKTRYGEGLRIHINIDKCYYSYLLPSLSLQLLVENAVKHNVVSKQKPLMLEIFTTAGSKLVVNNNLQRKQAVKQSTHIGLNNIRSKYKLIRQSGFHIVEGKNNFMVVLPLVWNDCKLPVS